MIRAVAPQAQDFTNRRVRRQGIVDVVEWAKNRTKSRVRAKVEHVIGVIKCIFGFTKVRYRGLTKNTHRLLVTCALATLYVVRRLQPRAVNRSRIDSDGALADRSAQYGEGHISESLSPMVLLPIHVGITNRHCSEVP